MDTYTLTALLFVPLGVGIELYFGRRQGRTLYRFDDTVVNLLGGLFEETLLLLFGALLLIPYDYVQAHWAPWHWDDASPWSWGACFIAIDFCYYWWHRFAHRVNFMWAWHATHHQSGQFNLSVALRQELGLTEWLFYLPIALLGIDAKMFAAVYTLTLLYQLPIHTRVIGKLGWLEWVINTPSSHRVHHGREEHYIDKNFGSVTLLWDHLFGTYQKEHAEPSYGLIKPWTSCNLADAYFGYWLQLVRLSLREERGWNRVRIWFASPNWHKVVVTPLPTGWALLQPTAAVAQNVKNRILIGLLAGVVVGGGIYLQTGYEGLTSKEGHGGLIAVAVVVFCCLAVTRFLDRSRPLEP